MSFIAYMTIVFLLLTIGYLTKDFKDGKIHKTTYIKLIISLVACIGATIALGL